MLTQIAKPAYRALHDVLNATWRLNPLIKKTHANKKVALGFIGDEHLNNPTLDDILFEKLKSQQINCRQHALNKSAYETYIATTKYPTDYYGGLPGKNNFTEKTLEHYTTFEFIDFEKVYCYVDIAACTSPFAQIVEQKFKVAQVYKQDLVYPRGINGNKIGGFAHETNLPDNSVDAITLHCSLEHFEGDSDKLFFAEVNRLLRMGGKALILPFYFAHTYTIHIDPAFNLLRNHHPAIDSEAELRYCNWYQFHSRHYDIARLKSRIIMQMPGCEVTLHRITNFKEVWQQSYLRWVLEITKK